MVYMLTLLMVNVTIYGINGSVMGYCPYGSNTSAGARSGRSLKIATGRSVELGYGGLRDRVQVVQITR